MKLLFEEYSYDLPYVQKVSLSAYFFLCEELNSAQVPYVGYFYSEQAKDSVFILPKVFLFAGEGKVRTTKSPSANTVRRKSSTWKTRPIRCTRTDSTKWSSPCPCGCISQFSAITPGTNTAAS